MKNKKGFIGFLVYVFVLFFTITGFIVALNNAVQINDEGGETNSTDGVTISKTIAPTDTENFFDITLKVNTQSKIEEIVKAQDIAVVVVMDVSYTMNDSWTDTDGTQVRKIITAQESAVSFLDKFYAASVAAPTAARKIGFVTYNRDSYELFGLSECNDKAEYDSMVADIGTLDPPEYSYDLRWTNMEAGLNRAQNMLEQTNIKNKYIIFITDGLPTTYSTTDGGYVGYRPYTGYTNSLFYNHYNNREIYGANYSDKAARKAEEKALSIRNDGITIYSVGIGISDGWTIHSIIQDRNGIAFDTDTEANNYAYYQNESSYKNKGARWYALTPGVTKKYSECTEAERLLYYDEPNYYKNWLKEYIGSNKYYDSNDAASLMDAYNKIFEDITEMSESSSQATWVALDPMGTQGSVSNIEFVGLYDDNNKLHTSISIDNEGQSDTASYSSNKNAISWDLKKSTYKEEKNGNVTYYSYEVKYRVRLENEKAGFDESKIYNTNDETTLTYVIRNNGVLSENKTLKFKIPSVVGYLGEFSFTKKSSYGDRNLKGAKFKLEHKADCTCHNGYIANMTDKSVTVSDKYATSDENGLVSFSNIPSGHQYTLTEVEVPKDHIKAKDHDIVVAYGVTTGNPDDNILVNTIKTGNLEITKRVEGNDEYSGKFKFKLEIDFDGADLTDGPYEYKIINGNGETVDSGKTNFASKEIELEKDQTYIIYKLPVGAVYTLQELTTNGYKVKYAVNSNEPSDLVIGDKATCNSTNSCRIENGGNNEVLFVNIAGYILPATGSSGMLIMTIIGLLLLIVPVIYIGYSFYKNEKKSGLTS